MDNRFRAHVKLAGRARGSSTRSTNSSSNCRCAVTRMKHLQIQGVGKERTLII